jgi:hypothetical protein
VRRGRFLPLLAGSLTVLILLPAAAEEGRSGRPSALGGATVRGDLSLLGQIRQGAVSNDTEIPFDVYGDVGVAGLRHGTTLDTYFRVEQEFGKTFDTEADFYAGVLRIPAAPPVALSLGRQTISEGPAGVFAADAGNVAIDPGWPVAFNVFGGQPRYFEPVVGPESLSQDEQIFGANVRTTRLKGAQLRAGFFQLNRDGRALRQLLSAGGTKSFATIPGMPAIYGSVAYDADHQNLDRINAGAQAFLARPRLGFHYETTYYKPQDGGERVIADINRREDPIFQLFSVSELLQFRGELRYNARRTVSTFANLSYQRYESLSDSFENGYLWGVGLLWLPGGDGLEVVRVQYYGADSGGGSVNGARALYENRVYERIIFRTKVDVAYFEKASNVNNTAVGSLVGIGYAFRPDLVAEINFEGNRNRQFVEDFRAGLFITYSPRVSAAAPGRMKEQEEKAAAPPAEAPQQGTPWRPVLWGPADFGGASWGPARWQGDR